VDGLPSPRSPRCRSSFGCHRAGVSGRRSFPWLPSETRATGIGLDPNLIRRSPAPVGRSISWLGRQGVETRRSKFPAKNPGVCHGAVRDQAVRLERARPAPEHEPDTLLVTVPAASALRAARSRDGDPRRLGLRPHRRDRIDSPRGSPTNHERRGADPHSDCEAHHQESATTGPNTWDHP